MMINVSELKRKVIDEFLINQSSVTNTPFKSVARIYTGESTNAEEKAKYSAKTNDCYPYVSTKDISLKGNVNFENGMYVPKGVKKFSIAPANAILLCIEGGNAGNKIAILKEAVCFVNKLCCFDIFNADNRFIYYYLLSNQFRNNFKEQMTGLIGGVSVKKLKELILPLPDITEQKKIAKKLDEIFAELDKIDEKQTRLATIQGKMEAKILKLAIQGRLVEQRPEEGTGEDLYKIILVEKQNMIDKRIIKREKPLNSIDNEEIPYTTPNSWKWIRLNDVGGWQSGSTPSKGEPTYYNNGNIPWLVTGDLNNGVLDDVPGRITKKALEETGVKLNAKGSVLIAMYGATIGKVAIANFECTTNQACCACNHVPSIDKKFIFYYLLASKDYFIKQGEGGAQPNISKEKIINSLFPLPPLEEQKRIVAKIEELLPLCKSLQK